MKVHIHKHIDPQGQEWNIWRETLPRRNGGVYKYWVGETINGVYGIKEDSLKEIKNKINTKFGTEPEKHLRLAYLQHRAS